MKNDTQHIPQAAHQDIHDATPDGALLPQPQATSQPTLCLIFACSGGSDTGAVTDQAARELTDRGCGKMFCLAGVGARIEAILAKTAQADQILAIDGCEVDCARKTLEAAGFNTMQHLRLTDLGLEKGATPVADTTVTRVVQAAQALASS